MPRVNENMEKWEKALNKFLESWKKRKDVIGVLVCGSFVVGDPSEHSDIDTHIILSDDVSWRERGNKIVDGFLIEYFANPAREIPNYFKSDYEDNSRTCPTMFVTGKILMDKKGEVKKLKNQAKKWLKKPFKKPNKVWIELQKYTLWDNMDNLEDLHKKRSKSYTHTYHNQLHKLISTYAKFLQFEDNHPYKTHEFLTDPNTRKKYLQNKFPDATFANRFAKAITETNKNKMLEHTKYLTTHVLKKMGGLNIDGWKIRSPSKK